MFSCNPESWINSNEILNDEIRIINEIKQQLLSNNSSFVPELTEYEINNKNIQYFLKLHNYNKENTYNEIIEWILWRREFQVDQITEESIANELSTKEAFWSGKDKKKQPCLIVTGRLHDISMTTGSGKSFQQFIIHLVEEGFKKTQEENCETDKVCILYDRRGLEFEHIDTFLYQSCTKVISDLQRWYSARLGTIYILHLNTLFWILYQVILRPLFGLLTGDKIIVLSNPSELLDYFDEDQLPPNFIQSGVVKESKEVKENESVTVIEGEIINNSIMNREI